MMFQSPYGDLGNTTGATNMIAVDFQCFSPLTGIWVIRLPKRFPEANLYLRFSPLTGIWVIRLMEKINQELHNVSFQSPYGDLGNTTRKQVDEIRGISRFSPLTGIRVIRHCLPVPALGVGSQAIFSNLRLFSPFSGTRVKNKNRAVSFFPLVTPFIAVFEIFKPRRFFPSKSFFFRLTYYPYLYLVYFF